MWNYLRKYLHFSVMAAAFMVGEVLMDLLQPELMSRIVDDGVLGLTSGGVGDLGLIWNLGVRMIVLVLFGGLCGSLNKVFAYLSGQNVGNEIRKDSFRKIMRFSFSQLDHFHAGSLITRVTNDITQTERLISHCVGGMIRTAMLMLGSIFFMFRLSHTFGLIVLCAFPFIVGCLTFCLAKANPLFSKLQAQLDAVNTMMQEDVSGIRVIKACVREAYERVRFGKANSGLVKVQFRVLVIFAFMNPAVNALMYIVVAVILLVGAFDMTGVRATPGDIMAAITYTTQLLNGILGLVMLFQNISRGLASWHRIREVLDTEPEMRDGSLTAPDQVWGRIEFRDVSFAYPGGQTVLEHIDLTVHSGETVAVMGATGCGKSSLVNLVPRFYDVTGGAVLVDGVDVRDQSQKALREKIAVAAQKSELFSVTVAENISWGAPDAPWEAVRAAAATAQAADFIEELPRGYDTVVAERGMSLSGGQRQRVSISRAVLKPAEILIFDDATSALDLKTEASLYAALRESAPGVTKLIVSQRVASARQADRIVVLEHGRVAGCGTHAELLRGCPAYQDICRSQLGEEELSVG